jgi:tRNA modification GTPase
VTHAGTYAACLTPAGAGALATLAVRGPAAWEIVRTLFQRPGGAALPEVPEAGGVWVGRFGESVGRDDVVLAVTRGGAAPWVELHCHGGREVVRLLLEVLAGRGVETVAWQECESRSGAVPLDVELLEALGRAPTARTAAILLDQHAGAFAAAVGDAVAALGRGDTAAACELLGRLDARAAVGKHLTEPWRVAVAGAPNVGKSSLVNALAGFQRSVVSPAPGTTRDVVTTVISVDGWPVELADTAGLRAAPGELERQGVERAQAAAAGADLCLWVVDASAAPAWPDANLPGVRTVINKVDLPAAWDLAAAGDAARVSAATGAGLPELCEALSRWLVPDPPPPGAAVPFTGPLCDSIRAALQLTDSGGPAEAIRLLRLLRSGRD